MSKEKKITYLALIILIIASVIYFITSLPKTSKFKMLDRTTEINDAKKIAITIPSVSYQSKFLNKKTILIESAIKSIFIIGSDNDSNSILKNVLLFFLVISLLPYFFLNSKTSLSFSPKVKYLHLSILKKSNIMTILHILYIFKKVCYN